MLLYRIREFASTHTHIFPLLINSALINWVQGDRSSQQEYVISTLAAYFMSQHVSVLCPRIGERGYVSLQGVMQPSIRGMLKGRFCFGREVDGGRERGHHLLG